MAIYLDKKKKKKKKGGGEQTNQDGYEVVQMGKRERTGFGEWEGQGLHGLDLDKTEASPLSSPWL